MPKMKIKKGDKVESSLVRTRVSAARYFAYIQRRTRLSLRALQLQSATSSQTQLTSRVASLRQRQQSTLPMLLLSTLRPTSQLVLAT